MDDLLQIVESNLRQFQGRYPRDVTDRVFVAIEDDPRQLRIYRTLVKESSQHAVNSRIGRMVKQLTGLNNLGRCTTPRSKLIKSYEEHG